MSTETNDAPETEEAGTGRRMDPDTVEYRDVVGYPGYRVGSDGSVWSCLVRVPRRSIRGMIAVLGSSWKQLKPSLISGYPSVGLYRNRKCSTIQIHRLVLEAFIGPCPDGMEACHFPDDDRTNCALSNLRWDTRSANHHDRELMPYRDNKKKFPRCKELLPLSQFGRHIRRRAGIACWCFVCDRKYQAERKDQLRNGRHRTNVAS